MQQNRNKNNIKKALIMMTKKDLKKLNKRLKELVLKQSLAEKSACGLTNVNAVLRGRHNNKPMIELAFELILEEEKRINDLKTKLQ